MTPRGFTIAALLFASLAAGTISDRPKMNVSTEMGGYSVLAADFHVHSFPLSWSTLSPWDTVIEARRQGLDVVALTPHGLVWVAKVGRWFARATGGPIVIVGEEIASPPYHLLAVGIANGISPRLPLSQAIDQVQRQGGVTIAAHPFKAYWPSYDPTAMEKLNGAEIVRPDAQANDGLASELREFFGRAKLTAIGSTDFHGFGPIGYSRTYVFVRRRTEQGVIEALREGRTVVYDRERAYGDPALIRLAMEHGGLPSGVPTMPEPGAARFFSRLAGILALSAGIVFNRW